MTCSVVVAGSGLGAPGLTVACPLARLAVGPTVDAARVAREVPAGDGEIGRTRPRRERARRARERSSEAFQWSRAARSRGHPGMRGVLSPSIPIPLLGAYGVSCRARVTSTLRHNLWRF